MKGKEALVYAGNGLYDNSAITVWTRGSTAEVIWKTQAKHRGNKLKQLRVQIPYPLYFLRWICIQAVQNWRKWNCWCHRAVLPKWPPKV